MRECSIPNEPGSGGAKDSRREQQSRRRSEMGGILLWLIGIPIPLIILLYFVF